ncbi:anthranilate synthase component I [Candidatus Poribacteria bacterium]|nr:anthranilate synthase component I [Candidatus Poribacteria bacterium]
MYFPSVEKFIKLKKDLYVSIYKEFSQDSYTPVSVYENLGVKTNSFLLESVQKHKKIGRYSIVGFNPNLIFKSKNNLIEIIKPGKGKIVKEGSPLKELRKILNRRKSIKLSDICPFQSGGVGCFTYEAVHFFENIPSTKPDEIALPDCYFLFIDSAIIFDHFRKKIQILKNIKIGNNKVKCYKKAIDEIEKIEQDIKNKQYNESDDKIIETYLKKIQNKKDKETEEKSRNNRYYNFVSNYTKKEYVRMVEKTKEYIRAGDIFQANLSQRFFADFNGNPFVLYKILRQINPSSFACFFNFEDMQIVSSSPERLVNLKGDDVTTRPIAGTRPRGYTEKEDNELRAELLLSPKERAEHIMLVDLERNDLGRVCEYGTVKVDELMILEKYSHVTHIVSNIKGKLRKGKDWLNVLRALFPGGTITGTPKIRCMEIINELETVARSLYTGSAGYLSSTGDMDMNILIRSFVIKNGKAYIQAGGGIVADSDPQKEYNETLYKAEALLKTLEIYKKLFESMGI